MCLRSSVIRSRASPGLWPREPAGQRASVPRNGQALATNNAVEQFGQMFLGLRSANPLHSLCPGANGTPIIQ